MKPLMLTMILLIGLQSTAQRHFPKWFKIKLYGDTWTIPLKLLEIKNDTLYASGIQYVETDEGFVKRYQLYMFPVTEIQRMMSIPPDPFPIFSKTILGNTMTPKKLLAGSIYHWIPWTKKFEIGGSIQKVKYLMQ